MKRKNCKVHHEDVLSIVRERIRYMMLMKDELRGRGPPQEGIEYLGMCFRIEIGHIAVGRVTIE